MKAKALILAGLCGLAVALTLAMTAGFRERRLGVPQQVQLPRRDGFPGGDTV